MIVDKKNIKLIIVSIALPIGYILWMLYAFHFDFFISDISWYWQDAQSWISPFNIVHVPGYPLLLALINGITFGAISPLTIMWSVAILANTVAVTLVYKITHKKTGKESAGFAAWIYLLWPFSGIVDVAHPVADALALMFVVLAIYLILNKNIG